MFFMCHNSLECSTIFLKDTCYLSQGKRVAGIPHADSISVFDARDAIETCSGLWGEEKDACYAVFGVDCGAEMWFDTVYKLEESLALETGLWLEVV